MKSVRSEASCLAKRTRSWSENTARCRAYDHRQFLLQERGFREAFGAEEQCRHGDSFHNDRHPDLRADFILANPPFNVSDWGGERLADDKRWRYGTPPKGNANFAWVQHIVHHLAPRGSAGFVLANGSMSSSQSGEGEIRKT